MRSLIALMLGLFLCASAGAQVPTSSSGWYQTGVFSTCNILVDRIGTGNYCNYRVNVLCMQSGLPFVGGESRLAPQSLPLTFNLYRPQFGYSSVGSITINALGSPADIVLNGEGGTWHKVGAYTGSDTCAPLQPRPPVRPTLCGEFGWFCG